MRLRDLEGDQPLWNSPIDSYDQLTEGAIKFILDETKSYFEETIRESEELTQRSIRMLFLLLPALAAIIAFCFVHLNELRPLNAFRFMLVVSTGGGFSNCIYFLLKLMGPEVFHYRGNQPKEILRPRILALRNPIEIEKALIVSEIEHYQVKIERMEKCNLKRVAFYKNAIYAFNAAAGIGVLAFILSI